MVRIGIIAGLVLLSFGLVHLHSSVNEELEKTKIELEQTKEELEKVKSQLLFEYSVVDFQKEEKELIMEPIVLPPVVIYRTLVQEAEFDLIVETANQDTNAIIDSIIAESTSFSLRNQNRNEN